MLREKQKEGTYATFHNPEHSPQESGVRVVGIAAVAASRHGCGLHWRGRGCAGHCHRPAKRKVAKPEGGGRTDVRHSVETEAESFARLDLAGRTIVHLGSRARLLIDRFVAETGGVLELGEGAMLLDRAEELPKIDLTIRSGFGVIAVRGTRFFAGPSRGAFGVFVDRGAVDVEAAGVTRRLVAGDGVDIKAPGEPPSEVRKWGKPRIDEAMASVGL